MEAPVLELNETCEWRVLTCEQHRLYERQNSLPLLTAKAQQCKQSEMIIYWLLRKFSLSIKHEWKQLLVACETEFPDSNNKL